jgi:hypothetical protein
MASVEENLPAGPGLPAGGCGAVRVALRAGLVARPDLQGAALDHAATCPPCAALLADDGALGRTLERLEPGAAPETLPPALFAGVEAALAHEARSPLARLRGLPTWARRLAVLVSVLPVVIYHALRFGWRLDIDVYPMTRLGLTLAAFALLALRNAWVALRPPHEPAESTPRACLFVALAAIASLLAAVWPAPYPMSPTLCWDTEEGMALECFTWGLAMGLPLVVTTVLLNRLNTVASLVLAAAAGGLVGSLVQAAQCPHVGTTHLLQGHVTIIVALVVAGALASVARRAWLDRRPAPSSGM